MERLAILSTHPIQYNSPLFRQLAQEDGIVLRVFYSKMEEEMRYDEGFMQEIVWDIPLKMGYESIEFQANTRSGRTALLNAIATFHPDVLFVWGWNFPGHFAAMRRFKGKIPIWFRGDSNLLDPLPTRKRLLRWCVLRLVYRFVDKAFYVGEANRAYYNWAGLKPNQLILGRHAVDNAFFTQHDAYKNLLAAELRKSLGISPTATTFMFVGKLVENKQPHHLCSAFIEMRQLHPEADAHLIVVGTGPLLPTLKSTYAGHRHIHFIGFLNQTELPEYYRIATCICLPSLSESWGLVVNEALCCGCVPWVSNTVGCAADLVKSLPEGKIVDAFDRSEWVSSLWAVVRESSAYNRKKIQQHIHQWSYRELIDSILIELHDLRHPSSI